MQMIYSGRSSNGTGVKSSAVAGTLLVVSCIDGFLKNTHGNPLVYVLKDTALLILLLSMLFWLGSNPSERPKGPWYGLWALSLYFVYMLVQVLNPGTGDVFSGIAGFRAEALFALLFFVGAIYFTNTQRLSKTVNVAIGAVTFASLVGIFQALAPNVWNSLSPSLAVLSQKFVSWQFAGDGGLPTAFPRAYGTLVDPAALGLASCAGFILAVGALARSRGAMRTWIVLAMLVMGTALLLSGSRASLAGFGAGLVVFLVLSWPQKSMRVPAIIAFIIVLASMPLAVKAGGGLVGGRFASNSVDYAAMTRAHSQNIVLASLPSHPLGFGLGATGAGGRLNKQKGNTRILEVDNVYFATLYQTGVAGLVIFCLVQGTLLLLAIRLARTAKSVTARATYISFASLQIALLVSGIWTQGSFTYAPVTQIFWLLSGALALPERVEGEYT